jgi:hypothetical protein
MRPSRVKVQIQKITKKVAELSSKLANPKAERLPSGRRRKRRMDVRFQYVDEKDKTSKGLPRQCFSLQ